MITWFDYVSEFNRGDLRSIACGNEQRHTSILIRGWHRANARRWLSSLTWT